MKFTHAWAKIAAQNLNLKFATAILAIVAIAQLTVIGKIAAKDPLIVERACTSKIVQPTSAKHTTDEIKNFLGVALSARFDTTTAQADGLLSFGEKALREKEQSTLTDRQMSQRIVIYDIDVNEKEILVNADRLISMGKIRSALPFQLRATVKTTSRNTANPYGLILAQTSLVEEQKEQK